MLGRAAGERTQEALQQESVLYGDIVQEDFLDSYRNLTYKAIMSMRWISTYCKHATFVLKVSVKISLICSDTFVKQIMKNVWQSLFVLDMCVEVSGVVRTAFNTITVK